MYLPCIIAVVFNNDIRTFANEEKASECSYESEF